MHGLRRDPNGHQQKKQQHTTGGRGEDIGPAVVEPFMVIGAMLKEVWI